MAKFFPSSFAFVIVPFIVNLGFAIKIILNELIKEQKETSEEQKKDIYEQLRAKKKKINQVL